MNVKTCAVCNEEKSLDQFYNKHNGKDSKCKHCVLEYFKKLYTNTERKETQRLSAKNWYKNNKSKHLSRCAERYTNKKEEIKEKTKARFHALSKEEQDIFRKRKQECKKRNPNYRAIKSYRRRLRKYLDSKVGTTIELLGCSPSELRQHLESLWQEGMSWSNYGLYGWHIDHKRPVSSFDLSCKEQAKQCFHYSNLQPLWAKDNLAKSNKIIQSHQTIPSPPIVRKRSTLIDFNPNKSVKKINKPPPTKLKK